MKRLFFLALLSVGVVFGYVIDNYTQPDGFPVLIPRVQKLQKKAGTYTLPKKIGITAPESAANEVELLKKSLQGSIVSGRQDIRLMLNPKPRLKSLEAYRLTIDASGVQIVADATHGLYNGVQTLRNMLRNRETLPYCSIEDWPDLPLRSVYLRLRRMTPREVPHFLAVIDAFGALKYNNLMLEFGENFPYKQNPFTKHKDTISLEDVKAIVTQARKNHIEIIPMLQILSHDEWLQAHPKYWTDIAEGKPVMSAWSCGSCMTSPLVRQLNTMAIQEQVELLKPSRFMLCLDEMEQCPHAQCPECKKVGYVKLWKDSTVFYTEFTFKQGCVPIICHDMYYPGNGDNCKGWEALEEIDKRTIICNWDYNALPRRPRFDFFAERGLPAIGMSYCERLQNVPALPYLVKQLNLEGVVLTYWHHLWKFSDPKQSDPTGFAATTAHGDFSWKTSNGLFSALHYDPSYQTMRLFVPEQILEIREGMRIQPVSLKGQFNYLFKNDDKFPQFDAAAVQKVKKELASTAEKFALETGTEGGYYGIVLSGGADEYPDAPVTIPVQGKCDAMTFLLFGGIPGNVPRGNLNHPLVGSLVIGYADGTRSTRELKFTHSINSWNETASGPQCRYVTRGNDSKGAVYGMMAVDWRNPSPGKEIRSLVFTTNKQCNFPLALLAVSAVNGELKASATGTASKLFVRTQKQTALFRRNVLADFSKGLGIAKVIGGTCKIVDDPLAPTPGKVLEITVPPTKDMNTRNRVTLDLKYPKGGALANAKSFFFDYRIEEPLFIDAPAFYLVDPNFNGKILYSTEGFHNLEGAVEWQRMECPVTKMKAHDKDCTPEEYQVIRVSFFIRFNDKPFRIYLDEIGVSPDVATNANISYLKEKIEE